MIEISGLNKSFHTGKENEVKALQNINLTIANGDYLVMVGANGSGKSTLLNCISGSVLPDSGSIKFAGQDVTDFADYDRSKWVARVFQNPSSGTASGLTVLDNFRLAAIRTKAKGLSIGIDNKFIAEVRDKVAGLHLGLENKLNQTMGTLSGGQRQALTLLMSIMDSCKILLLDEPTAALDPRSANKVMQIADEIISNYRLTAILVTHNLKEAYTYGERIIQLSEWKIIKDLDTRQKKSLSQAQLFDWFL